MKRDNVITVKDCLVNGGYGGFVFERSLKYDAYNGGREYIIESRSFDRRNGAAIVEVNFIDDNAPQKGRFVEADILNDRLVTRSV